MAQTPTDANVYFVPAQSKWPFVGSIAMMVTMVGVASWLNDAGWGRWTFYVGIAMLVLTLFWWFSDVVRESQAGSYNHQVDGSFRMGMIWFIFSEVMFFGAFFGALFYARAITMPWLADLDHKILWPDFAGQWGNTGPAGVVESFNTMGPFPIPTINTALLLLSGVTLTIAHHALRAGHRRNTAVFLFATILLGAIFMGFQAYEYIHAYQELNLKLTSGIYGSTFFMLTGFHGFHVTMGAIMLSVVLYRVLRGHFTPENHFGFEGAAWYWHFVDVVWLGLYVVVYWL